jgi:hypothetical protein
MRHTHSSTKRPGTQLSLRLFLATGSLVLWSLSGVISAAPDTAAQTTLPSTPEELLAMDPDVFATTLTTSRPRPVSSEHKSRILGSLSAEGVMNQLTGSLQNKLTALGPLLRAADRDAVYDVRVVDVPLARIGLYERTVLLISGPALALLSAEDLRAQVAHELGHEYFATEYDRATQAGDRRRLRELELMCDAIGMVMLHDLGMDPSRLMRSVEKLTLYNRRLFQTAVDESGYPTLDERRKFTAALRGWIAKGRSGGEPARRSTFIRKPRVSRTDFAGALG